jgi:hypothetical protein
MNLSNPDIELPDRPHPPIASVFDWQRAQWD